MHYYTYFFIAIILTLSACNSDDDEPAIIDTNPNTEVEVETSEPTGVENYLQLDADYLFNQNKLPTFELNLPESALAQINANPTAEQYVEGSLTFEGETISPVGIRYKGSIGAFVNCVSGADWANPSGSKTCTKLSMKIKINWDDPEARFYGLKKLQFHSMNNDPTQMRERLGYWLYRSMGVPTPRAVHARLIINGKYNGLFALVEQIDGRFARHNFEDGTGNIYKEVWPVNEQGKAFFDNWYLQHLKTNENDNPSVALMRTFGEEIENADDTTIKDVIANRMDIDEIISYAVVDRTIRNDDGAFHWYCTSGDCGNHNYYWYENPSTQKFHLLPWDLDHAFVNIISNENPVTPIADDWGEITNNCEPFAYGWFGVVQRSAACDKLTGGWAKFETEYQEKLEAFKTGPFREAQVNTLLNLWETQIKEATAEAEELYDDALTTDTWQNSLSRFKNKIEHARNK